MVIHRALDEVLRSWSHVAVLRALLDTNTGCTGNEVARIAGMHPRSAIKALSSLEILGIVRRQRGGRDHLFTLNRDHRLVREALLPLYASEREFPGAVMSALASLLHGKVMSAIVFGSVAKREETPQSDLDMCCIVKGAKQKEPIREVIQSQAPVFYRHFGVKIAPVVFTLREFQRKSKNPLIKDIVANGRLVTGKKPEALLYG